MRLPNIVAIEGIDASGKATQAKMLADHIESRITNVRWDPHDKFVLRKSFPAYETPTGKLIAEHLQGRWGSEETPCGPEISATPERLNAHVLQSLMTINRFELADEIERACVVEGRTVVLDRYWASAVAYGAAAGLDAQWLESIHSRLPKAHHVFIDVPVEESFRRRPERRDENEKNVALLRAARVEYLALFERKGVDTSFWNDASTPRVRVSPSGWYLVDGMGAPEEVHARVREALEL